MSTKKIRLALTLLAVLLPGPWTPVVVLAYVLGRATESPDRPAPEPPEPARARPPDHDPYAYRPAAAAHRDANGVIP